VSKALEYYDSNKEKYRGLFKHVDTIEFVPREDGTKYDQIVMYDKNNKLLYRIPYEIIGIYNNLSKTWAWAWSWSSLKKISTTTSRKILNYAFDLDPMKYHFLKTELTTSRFRINTEVQLDIHVALGSYLSKNPIIMEFVWYENAEIIETDANGLKYKKRIKHVGVGDHGDAYQIYYLILDFNSVNIDEYIKNPITKI
jgi:hypothetical protein